MENHDWTALAAGFLASIFLVWFITHEVVAYNIRTDCKEVGAFRSGGAVFDCKLRELEQARR